MFSRLAAIVLLGVSSTICAWSAGLPLRSTADMRELEVANRVVAQKTEIRTKVMTDLQDKLKRITVLREKYRAETSNPQAIIPELYREISTVNDSYFGTTFPLATVEIYAEEIHKTLEENPTSKVAIQHVMDLELLVSLTALTAAAGPKETYQSEEATAIQENLKEPIGRWEKWVKLGTWVSPAAVGAVLGYFGAVSIDIPQWHQEAPWVGAAVSGLALAIAATKFADPRLKKAVDAKMTAAEESSWEKARAATQERRGKILNHFFDTLENLFHVGIPIDVRNDVIGEGEIHSVSNYLCNEALGGSTAKQRVAPSEVKTRVGTAAMDATDGDLDTESQPTLSVRPRRQ